MVKIDSYDKTLKQLFTEFYCVPDFQREYVWETKQVNQLLDDILVEYSDSKSDSEYFIGSIVTCKDQKGSWSIIDGQQRITTLIIVFCALRDYLKSLNSSADLSGVKQQLFGSDTNLRGETINNPRLQLQYPESGNYLEQLITEKQNFPGSASSVSIDHMKEAYSTALNFLETNFPTEKEARGFFGFLINNVKVIRVETKDVAHALKVFETINDRGVSLNPMDLLKNLMFIKTTQHDYQILKQSWKEITSVLEKCEERPLRFLRYFILALYDTGRDPTTGQIVVVREDEIYDWFRKNEIQCGYGTDPLGFVARLKQAALDYSNFIQGENTDDTSNSYLDNLGKLSGVARQHLILLLAGRQLSKENFLKLSSMLENLFFVYIMIREPTRQFERNFTQWAGELRQVNDTTFQDFLENRLLKEIQDRTKPFENAFNILTEKDLQSYRVKYILAKIAQFIDQTAFGSQPANSQLSNYISNEIDIEHILPMKPRTLPSEFANFHEYDEYKHKLGNLTLLEKTINTSISNEDYEVKKTGYASSRFLLTKSISVDVSFGKDTRMTRAARMLPQYPKWDKKAIEDRQKELAGLAVYVWGVNMASDKGENATFPTQVLNRTS